MKKIVSILLTMTLLLSLFGCQENAAEDVVKNDSENQAGETSVEKVVLKVSAGDTYKPIFDQLLVLYNAEKPLGKEVEIEFIDKGMSDGINDLALDGPAGLGPDILQFSHQHIGAQVIEGHIAPINFTDDELNKVHDRAQAAMTYEGDQYIVPTALEALFLIYNKAHFEEGVTSFNEFRDQADNFKNGDDGSIVFLSNITNLYTAFMYLGAYTDGEAFGDQNTNGEEVILFSEKALAGYQEIYEWYNTYFPQGMKDTSSAGDILKGKFFEGSAGAITNGPWLLKKVAESGIDYGVQPIPSMKNGQSGTPWANIKGFAVSSYSENQEVAGDFLKFILSDQGAQIVLDLRNEIVPLNTFLESDVIKNDPILGVVAEQFYNSVPIPNIIEYSVLESVFKDVISVIVTGDGSVESILSELEKGKETYIQQKNIQ